MQLLVDELQVTGDGVDTEPQMGGDFLVGVAFRAFSWNSSQIDLWESGTSSRSAVDVNALVPVGIALDPSR